MAGATTDWTLDYDEVVAFLSEFDDGLVLETIPLQTPPSVSGIPPRNKLKRQRRYSRVEIAKTRQEIANLELRLQILKEKHEFREFQKHIQSNCGTDWRLFASRERISVNEARTEQPIEKVQARKRPTDPRHRSFNISSVDGENTDTNAV